MCRILGVSRQGYYAWQGRGLSEHKAEDQRLAKEILGIFEGSGGTYGSPRIQKELKVRGKRISRRRVERLMRAANLRGRVSRVYRSNPRLHDMYEQHPNRLWKLHASRRDQIWVGDITYLPLGSQWRYLAVVMDQYTRRVLGWSLSRRRGTRLTRTVFDLAIRHRRLRKRLIFHSDRGSEYAGQAFARRLRSRGVWQSMTRGGSPSDNAHMESFFHSLKADVIHGLRFTDERQLRSCIKSYVHYYNHKRLHSALGYQSPVEYERRVA
jgi:transposase InsO family protein